MMKKKKNLKLNQCRDRASFVVDDIGKSASAQWDMFVKVVAAHVDPVLASILYTTELLQFDVAQKVVRVATLKKFILFQDLFIEQKKIYQEYLDRIFGFQTMLIVEFVTVAEPKKVDLKTVEFEEKNNAQMQSAKQVLGTKSIMKERSVASLKDSSLDLSNTQKWKFTRALLEHFGGTVREIVKDTNEFDA